MFFQEQCLECQNMYVETIKVRNARYKYLWFDLLSIIKKKLGTISNIIFINNSQHNLTVHQAKQPRTNVNDTSMAVGHTESS